MLLLKEVKLNVDEEAKLVVMFDPAYRPDRHSRTHNSSIEVSYKEHPHKAGITVITKKLSLSYYIAGLYSFKE